MYNDPNCRPWTSRQWAPPGYHSRYDVVQQNKATEADKDLLGPGGADESRLEKAGYRDANPSATSSMGSAESEH